MPQHTRAPSSVLRRQLGNNGPRLLKEASGHLINLLEWFKTLLLQPEEPC